MVRKKGINDQKPTNPEDINTFINKLFDEIIETNGMPPGPGETYRFEVSVNQDGITITPNTKGQVQTMKMEDREPLVDVIDKKEGVIVVAELPGAEKKGIELHADHEKLSMKAEIGKKVFSRLVPLPSTVDPTTAVAVYNNGVLEISFKRSNTYRSIVKIDVR